MKSTLATAVRALMGTDASIEETALEGGRRQIVLRGLPRPTQAGDPRFFRHHIAANWSDVQERGAGGGEDEMENRPEGVGYGDGEEKPGIKSAGSVRGVASSTSVDFYGTEMALDALEAMKAQFLSVRGVPLLPAHSDFFSVPEWDKVIGRSVSAEIVRANVAEAYDQGEPGYILDVEFALLNVAKAAELRERVDADQEIGLSIGGWFTAMSVIYNEDSDELERVIILAVQLDHTAVTRMPANPDSMGLTTIRSALGGIFNGKGPDDSPATRDAVRIGDTAALAERVARLVVEAQRTTAGDPSPANQPSVTASEAPSESLDRTGETGNDASTPSPAARPTSSSEEEFMTPEQIEAIVQRAAEQALTSAVPRFTETVDSAVRAATAPLDGRLTALESLVAERAAPPVSAAPPAAPSDTDEVRALRSQVTALQGSVTRLANEPVRRGRHGGTTRVPTSGVGTGADATFRSIVAECNGSQNGMALAAIVERSIDVLAEVDGPAPVYGAGSVRNLQRLLASGLRAAQADGLINQPTASANWQ